jgi:hypothetical protein
MFSRHFDDIVLYSNQIDILSEGRFLLVNVNS